ncbi:hypothetical protein ESCO_004439 [Escovopsis weberi]|uniref:Uncharacterized protein n=1 Tax=Escovopsis weberi TaxID=150374 RepID=A0A0M8N6V7_ESCWE|nr:hypothetical protein ESCO_004439 [Escovopsis weberi]
MRPGPGFPRLLATTLSALPLALALAQRSSARSTSFLTLSVLENLSIPKPPLSCVFAYNAPVWECGSSDLASGAAAASTCSAACREELRALQAGISASCAGASGGASGSLLALAQAGRLVAALCDSAEAAEPDPRAQGAPQAQGFTTQAPAAPAPTGAPGPPASTGAAAANPGEGSGEGDQSEGQSAAEQQEFQPASRKTPSAGGWSSLAAGHAGWPWDRPRPSPSPTVRPVTLTGGGSPFDPPNAADNDARVIGTATTPMLFGVACASVCLSLWLSS